MTNTSAPVYSSHDDNDRKEDYDSDASLYDNKLIQPMSLVTKRIPLVIRFFFKCF